MVVGLLLVSTLCMQRLKGPLRKGMQQRRLAGGGGEESEDTGDESGPPSPDFTEFCLELGAWSPSNPLPGNPRSSPAFVEAFFESLDQTAGQGSPPGVAPTLQQLLPLRPKTGEKRPLDDGDSDEEVVAGPSWKVAKTTPPSDAGEGPWSQLMSTSSSSTLPVSSQAASISPGAAAGVVPAQVPGSSPYSKHPFVRLPILEPGANPRQFLANKMRDFVFSSRFLYPALPQLRELLRKPSLNASDALAMVDCAENLARHAYFWLQSETAGLRPFIATFRLARRFMVIYHMLCASRALHQDWSNQPWWKELMDRIPHTYSFEGVIGGSVPAVSRFYVDLARDLSLAIQQLKSGSTPPDFFIIDVHRRLLCLPHSSHGFKREQLDPWRQDDAESQQ
ncbi:hypothetical protein Emed_003670 [Eimeria media]